MTFNRLNNAVILGVVSFLITGCPGGGDGQKPGITVQVAETHSEAAEAHSGTANPENSGVPGKPATLNTTTQANSEHGHDEPHKHAHAKDGVSLSIYVGYLVIGDIELQRCTSVSTVIGDFLDSVIGKAYAHTGGGEPDPVTGRSLSEPNVIDIMTADNTSLALGGLPVAPGGYCGLHASIAPANDQAHGQPPGISLLGAGFYFETNYRNPDGSRTAVDFDSSGVALPRELFVPFHEPLILNEANRSGLVTINLAYDQWFHDVDVTLLATDAAEREKVLENILGSMSAHAISE